MTQMEENKSDTFEIPPNAVDITPDGDGGVLKEVLKAGEGDDSPSPGDKVFVHYNGTLTNGDKFDSSRDRGEMFEFLLGRGNVIKGWDLCVATMKKGELAKLICKSEYAYGENGSPPKIPGSATLIFEIELFRWEGEDISEDKDGSIIKHQIQKGEGSKTPNDGSTVKVHYVGKYKGQVFEDKELQFEIGEGMDHGIVEGLEIALTKFKEKEKSKLVIAPQHAFGAAGKPEFNIPPNATVEYEVELINFEKSKESWQMNTEEKLEQSQLVKDKGGKCFKEGKYKSAVAQYKKIVSYLDDESGLEEEQETKRHSLILAAHLNLAMCYLKIEDFANTIEHCDKAMELDSTNVKSYFRRGEAYLHKNEIELALEDFKKVLEIDPQNKAAKNKVVICNQKVKQFKEKEKKLYGGMFSKFAAEDQKKEKYTKNDTEIENEEDTDELKKDKEPEINGTAKEEMECGESN